MSVRISGNEVKPVKREIKFIMPTMTNDGKPLTLLLRQLEGELINAYYGYTLIRGVGGYKSQTMNVQEEVEIYYLAIEASQEDALKAMIVHYGVLAEQECMYYVGFDGSVQFLSCSTIS